MDEKTAEPSEAAATAEAIRAVCEKTDANGLWQALEAEGIQTTPGVVHQVLTRPKESDTSACPAANVAGLSPEDLAGLAGLAAKVGGVAQLIRILEDCQGTPG